MPDDGRGAAPLNVLFLCTGNACRSQMAEGWLRFLGGNRCNARSAGIEAHGINPRAIAAMAEAGIDISAQASTVLTDEHLAWADLVVTVCSNADRHCPVLPGRVERMHWPLADPAAASGSEAEIAAVFRATRDEIRRRVLALIAARSQPAG